MTTLVYRKTGEMTTLVYRRIGEMTTLVYRGTGEMTTLVYRRIGEMTKLSTDRRDGYTCLQTKEEPPSGGLVQDVSAGEAQDLHNTGQLFHLVLPGEQGVPRVQLRQDTAKAPHVDGHGVGQTQDHLWGAVKPTLDVRVH